MYLILGTALILLRVAFMIFEEVSDIRRNSRSSSGNPQTTTHHEISDPWITGLYPPDFAGRHDSEPRLPHSRQGSYHGPGSLDADACDALVIEYAFELEFRARRMFAGAQFKGILQGQRSLVWAAREARAIKQLLAGHTPGPIAREHLDRALAWWAAAMAAGMRIFEWDKPGYDEVTSDFRNLERLASRPVPIATREHGVAIRSFTHTVDSPMPPDHGWAVIRILLLAALGLFMLIFTCRMECPGDNYGPPPTCAQQHEQVLADIDEGLTTGRLSFVADAALSPAQLAALREVRTALTAGDPKTAAALWDAVRDEQPESAMLSVALFLLTTCS